MTHYLGQEVKLIAKVVSEETIHRGLFTTGENCVLQFRNGFKIQVPVEQMELLTKEPKYRVIDKRLGHGRRELCYFLEEKTWDFYTAITKEGRYRKAHTRQQLLEAGFDVFDDDNYKIEEDTE